MGTDPLESLCASFSLGCFWQAEMHAMHGHRVHVWDPEAWKDTTYIQSYAFNYKTSKKNCSYSRLLRIFLNHNLNFSRSDKNS